MDFSIFFSRTPPTHQFLEKYLREIFTRYGRPDRLDSDGGPQFQSEAFGQFLSTWGITHRVSSPYYPQSNGRAELGVKTAKRLLHDNTNKDGALNNDKVACAILQYHNTPLRDSPMSPAQLLFGRALADFLPVNPKAYKLHPYWSEEVKKRQVKRTTQHKSLTARYNIGTRALRPLSIGQNVLVQHHTTKRWSRPALILKVLPHRKYQLQMQDTGNISYRNRRFIKPVEGSTPCISSSADHSVQEPAEQSTPVSKLQSDIDSDYYETDSENSNNLLPGRESMRNALSQAAASSQEQVAPGKPALAARRLLPHNKRGLKE